MEKRNLYTKTWEELSAEKSMIFIAGQRQSGKTTLGKIISERFSNNIYFNWDIADDRATLLENAAFFTDTKRKDSSKPLLYYTKYISIKTGRII